MSKILFITNAMIFCLAVFSIESQAFQKTTLGVKAEIDSVVIEVQFYSPTVVRVIKSPMGTAFTKESLSVTKTPVSIKLKWAEQGDELSISRQAVTTILNLKTGHVAFKTPDGKTLLN